MAGSFEMKISMLEIQAIVSRAGDLHLASVVLVK
jgi:hypothetical protein